MPFPGTNVEVWRRSIERQGCGFNNALSRDVREVSLLSLNKLAVQVGLEIQRECSDKGKVGGSLNGIAWFGQHVISYHATLYGFVDGDTLMDKTALDGDATLGY